MVYPTENTAIVARVQTANKGTFVRLKADRSLVSIGNAAAI